MTDRRLAVPEPTMPGKSRTGTGASIGVHALLVAALVTMLGCAPRPSPPPSPPGPCPTIPDGTGLRAGFARIDITTPPGPGLLGYGTEGQPARGHRQRIYARAAAIEDARGERLLLIVAELDFISAALHRSVAERVTACSGLGADRIVLSATHTHAAPGHFAAHAAYDRYGSMVDGFDPAILDFFATRIARAALEALEGMRPARAAWGDRAVWGVTRIRSWTAHAADPHGPASRFSPPDVLTDERYRHVDPTLTLLRVDTGTVRVAPAGAFAIFAVHGTGLPAVNDLIDADLHGVAARMLERHIDTLNAVAADFAPHAAVLFANSAEGDVLPARDSIPACDPPVLRRAFRPTGRGAPPGEEAWIARPGFDARACLDHGLARTLAVGSILGDAAIALFDSLGTALSADVSVGVAYETVSLRGPGAIAGLCDRGRTGTSTVAGAETGRTRLLGWKLFGVIPSGFESGGSAIAPGRGCASPKRTIPGLIERVVAGEHPFEEAAQFTVVRLGSALLGTVPFEATTTTGARMRDTLRAIATGRADAPDRFALIGLANGYLNYVTTAVEYTFQHYEGGSTLYGPGSAVAYTARIAGLARALADANWSSPPAVITTFPFPPVVPRRILPHASPDPAMTHRSPRIAQIDADVVVARWTDGLPGAFTPANGPLLVIERQTPRGWSHVTWDDDPAVEVRVVKVSGRHAEWQVRWAHACAPPGEYRVVLLARSGLPEESIVFNVAGCT